MNRSGSTVQVLITENSTHKAIYKSTSIPKLGWIAADKLLVDLEPGTYDYTISSIGYSSLLNEALIMGNDTMTIIVAI